MSATRPVFKVIVPCYKYAHFLEGCVRSVLDQEGTDVRVLIIDDLSPDDTPTVAAASLRRTTASSIAATARTRA